MTSTLKRQLAALAAPSSSLLVPERRRSSILFTPQDAAKYDKDTFYQIGQDGLNELLSINPDLFEPFVNSVLFSESSKTYERVIHDNEANEKLDEIINEFLLALHPYVMMKASLKCMEWLVYRFHIERFNVDAILKCALPYYDTKAFVMIIQVLEIEKYQVNQEWEWLVPCKQSGAPLRKAVLFDNSNSKFVVWLFSTFQAILHIHRKHSENLRIFLGFLTTTLVGILNKLKSDLIAKPKKVENQKIIGVNILNKIFKLLTTIRDDEAYKNLKNNEEIYSMAYVVMTMLAVCCREIPGMAETVGSGLKQIFKLIIVKRGTVQITETYLLLNLMIDFLNRKWEFNNRLTFNNTLNDISIVSQQWNVSNLATKLILYNVDQDKLLTPSKILSWVNEIEMGPETRSEILLNAYYAYRKSTSQKSRAQSLLVTFEKQHPVEFEIACSKDKNLAKDLAKYKGGRDFVTLSEHSDPAVRASAVTILIKKAVTIVPTSKIHKNMKHLNKKKNKKPMIPDRNQTAIVLAPRFADDNVDVLVALLKIKTEKLLKIFSRQSLLMGIATTLKKNVSIKSNKIALKKLCDLAMFETSDENLKQAFGLLVPFLYPRSPKQLKLVKIVLESKFAKENSFLKKYQPVIANPNVTFGEVCKESYQIMSTLDDKFKSEIFTKLDTPSKLTFGCILLPTADIYIKLLPAAEMMGCWNCTTYPVLGENFPKCVKYAERKKKLSFELVLTTLCKTPTTNFQTCLSILKFVWRNAEHIENRESAMKFLQQYLQLCFKSSSEQYNFWLQALRHLTASSIEEEQEFYLIRAIQFTTAFVKRLEGLVPWKSTISQKTPTRGRKSTTNASLGAIETHNGWKLVEIILALCLPIESARVRACSLDSLKVISSRFEKGDDLQKFIEELLEYKNEIQLDPGQIPNAIAHVLTDKKSLVKSEIVRSLMQTDLDVPTKLGLLKVCTTIGDQIFKELYPIVTELLESNPSSIFLLKILSFYDGSFNEKLLLASLNHKDPAKIFLKKIDRDQFENYSPVEKRKIFSILVEKTLACGCPEIKVAVLRCARKWTLDASIVAMQLTKCLELEKRQAPSKKDNSKQTKDNADWVTRSEVVLEFIQGKKRLTNKTKLVQPLFHILKKCIALEEQIPVEYLKQLVLTSLTMCCQEDDDLNPEESKDFVSFDVQTVIDCLRCSRNPQTHHHALILLNYAASRYHEQVLHGIMSLFTFMGNSVLRQDDAYSTQLIQQTVINIIPSLAKSNKGSAHRLNLSAGIFRVFTSAVQDIPAHRRLPVFTSLANTLEPEFTMWQLCVILVDNALQRDRKRSNLNADLELAVDLVWGFGPEVVAKTVGLIYKFLVSLPIFTKNCTSEQFSQMKIRQSTMERSVLDFGRKESFRDVLITVNYVLELVTQICVKFADIESEEVEYDLLLEKCLLFSKKSAGLSEEKLFRLITQKNLDVIDKINAALDPLKFIEAVALILVRDDTAVKRKVMEMLNQRILQKVEWFGDLKNLLDLVPLLLEMADIAPETDESTTLVQTAFFSLKLLARHMAIQHPDQFVPVFDMAKKHSNDSNKLLRASSLLCLSELFCLKSLILPNLNEVTNAILKAFKSSAKLQSSITEDSFQEDSTKPTEAETSSMSAHLLCISTMTCLNKMIEHLGSFVGMKFLRKVLIAVLSISNTFGSGEKASHRSKVFEQKLKGLLKVISGKIPLRNVLVPIREAYSSLIQKEPIAAITLMRILKDTLLQTSKADFTLSLDSLTTAYLEDFLQIREKLNESNMTNQQIEEIEDSVIDCLISGLVLKMTESHFRPMYHKIFNWAKESEYRLITFYRFSAEAAEKLKSLFVTFAGYVTHDAIQVLHKDVNLAKSIVKFLYYIFSNDKEGFVTTDRFNSLVQPLLDLVESEYVLNGDITITQVNDCIIQLAVATNDLNRWQHLIELIALKSSHSNKVVRLNILSTLEAAANELTKDFLPLLPPAVPFLAELMNDDDPEVEAETQQLLLKLENIVGEPLQPYFTS